MIRKLFLASGVLAGVLGLGGLASSASAAYHPGCGVRPAPVVRYHCPPRVVCHPPRPVCRPAARPVFRAHYHGRPWCR
jgi:hypothetical protein